MTERGDPQGNPHIQWHSWLTDIAIHEHSHKLDHCNFNTQPTPSFNALYTSNLRKGVTWSVLCITQNLTQ